MKALSVMQPWAAYLMTGEKSLEVRSRPTAHRGELLICASATPSDVFWLDPDAPAPRLLHAGCMLGIVNIEGCRKMQPGDADAAMVAYDPLAYVWQTSVVCWVRPDPIKGRLGLYDVPDATIVRLPHDKALELSGQRQAQWVFDYPCPQGDVKFHTKRPIIE